jgi:serine/threonine protein phosphatase 1
MATYAIADLHGRFDLLTSAYQAIKDHAGSNSVEIIHLGDYVDRGPESGRVIEWLMDDSNLHANWTRICLRGNHEDIMVQTLTKPLHPDWWIGNGGGMTLISYGHAPSGAYRPEVIPDEHIAWMKSLPRLHVDNHRVFVHAGVSPSLPLDQQDDQAMGWMIYPDGAEDGHGDRHVVHGHHAHENGPIQYTGRTNLDTQAWYTGRLVIGVFYPSKPGGAVETIEVLSEAHKAYVMVDEDLESV